MTYSPYSYKAFRLAESGQKFLKNFSDLNLNHVEKSKHAMSGDVACTKSYLFKVKKTGTPITSTCPF
jgi:hypothetical protein